MARRRDMQNQTQEQKQTIVKETGNIVYEVTVENYTVKIEKRVYPTRYANRYGKIIVIDKETGIIKVAYFCDGWATGPCRGMTDYVTLHRVEDRELAEKLYERVVSNLSDDTDIAKLFDELVEIIEEREREIEEELNELFDTLTEKLERYDKSLIEEIKKMSVEELIELLRECI